MGRGGLRVLWLVVFVFAPCMSAQALQLNEHFVRNVGIFKGSAVEEWTFTNTQDGQPGYFTRTLPTTGHAPYPTLVLVNSYGVFPEDSEWLLRASSGGIYYDSALPREAKLFTCQTPNQDCPIVVDASDAGDVARTGDVLQEGSTNSLADWALAHGCAVVIPFGRHYAGRGTLTVIHDVADTLLVLKWSGLMASTIDSERIMAVGKSHGAELVVHSLALLGSRLGRQFSIRGAVGVGTWVNGRQMFHYYKDQLPTVQFGNALAIAQMFAKPYLNRIARSLGPSPDSVAWDPLTVESVAAVWPNVPLLLIAGTDDMMVPVQQTIDLGNALKATGLVTLKIYPNGQPRYNTLTVLEAAHGVFGLDMARTVRDFIVSTMTR
jgi:acetyl esterase/lipase